MRLKCFCTAQAYQLPQLIKYLNNADNKLNHFSHILHQQNLSQGYDIFYFAQGCAIAWNLPKNQENNLYKILEKIAYKPLKTIEADEFSYQLGDKTLIRVHGYFNVDIIELEADDPEIKLALAYGLAQSVKLMSFERLVEQTIQKNINLPDELAKTGKIKLSRRQISKRIGEIFIARSSVNFKSEFLTVPKFFWEHTSLEEYYLMLEDHLDIPKRVEILNAKMDALYEIFDMLTAQLQHQQSTFLEWIIIVLIVLEVLFSVIKIIKL